jgi:hypothetical protein
MRILRVLFVGALVSTSIAFAQTPNNRTLVLLTTDMWTVPNGASVGTITVEAWGGGGGGSTAGGGQGGGYIKASFVVAPNQQIRVTIGSGGAGGADKGTNGSGTTIDAGPGFIFNVTGGAGAGNGVAGGFTNPTNVNTVSKFYFRGAVGQMGSVSKVVATSIIDPSNAVLTAIGGDGGDAGSGPSTHGFGSSETCTLSRPASTFQVPACNPYPLWSTVLGAGPLSTFATPGVVPGGGGGGAPITSFYSKKLVGAAGASGMVIITY